MINSLLQVISPWLDFLWLPIAVLAVHKGHRIWAAGFVLACAFMMRLQVELMESVGYPTGILPLLDSDLMRRGMVTYSVFYVIYIALAYYSPGSHKHVMMAATISMFFVAMFVSSLIMLL